MARKTFVLDSSVIISSPYSLLSFDEHTIILADAVIDELGEIKNRTGEEGRNAREALRLLDMFRQQGNLLSGVTLPHGGTLRVEMNHYAVSRHEWEIDRRKARIIGICEALSNSEQNVILVSNDMSLRVKASLLGLLVEEYRTEQAKGEYKGRCTLDADCSEAIDRFYQDGYILPPATSELSQGEYVLLKDPAAPSHTALALYEGSFLKKLQYGLNQKPYKIAPRNVGQKFAIDALLAPAEDVPLVILKGPAGTAKTLLALACGLEQATGANAIYDRILVTRPNCKFDEDIGFLKGTEEEKIGPLLRPIWDNLDYLTRDKNNANNPKSISYAQQLFDNGTIVAQALAYMRGRSISNTWIIIDEAQNMTPLQAFGIISRAGTHSKIILAGDPEQVDNPYLDRWSNGLSYASERMKGSPLCRQVTFSEDECERSSLAVEAIKRLSPKGAYLNEM